VFKRKRKPAETPVPAWAPRPEPEFPFVGLAPWNPGAKLAECEVDGRRLDLRSAATYLGYDFGEYGMLTLRFLHEGGDGAPEQRVILEFDNLRSFIAVPSAPGARLAGELEGWDYWPGAPGRANVTVYAGDNNLSFSCGGVRLSTEEL
jgi:hypothetical protein